MCTQALEVWRFRLLGCLASRSIACVLDAQEFKKCPICSSKTKEQLAQLVGKLQQVKHTYDQLLAHFNVPANHVQVKTVSDAVTELENKLKALQDLIALSSEAYVTAAAEVRQQWLTSQQLAVSTLRLIAEAKSEFPRPYDPICLEVNAFPLLITVDVSRLIDAGSNSWNSYAHAPDAASNHTDGLWCCCFTLAGNNAAAATRCGARAAVISSYDTQSVRHHN
jgi:hypothetical protein